jgi:5-bromo-4-chloroindolyl phosphate hydrolysis protein
MLKSLLQLASNIPAALVGGGVFVVTLLVLNLGILLAIGISVVVYVVTGLLIFPAKTALEQRTQDILKEVLKESEHKLATLRGLRKQIKKPGAQKQLETICTVGDNIVEAVKKNPETAVSAKQFSGYYLDSTIKIVQRYVELTEHTGYSDDVQQAVVKVEGMLAQVQKTFEQQLSHILRDKMLDLDTELAVLQETIDIDNI